MPGTIRDIFVKKNDIVKKGDKIAILDAMKMDNELLATMDGRIVSIPVNSDDKVAKNAIIAEIAPLTEEECKKGTNKTKAQK